MKQTTTAKSSPRDVFLYLLAIVTLYISIWRFIDLFFEYINIKLPDQLYYSYVGSLDEIRISIASLLIVFPVYLALTWYLRKDSIRHPEKREMKVRKWLLNFTLFLAAITIIVDLIVLIDNFLKGELTLRFVLKVLVVLVIAAAVFSYYLWDLRRTTLPDSKPSKLLAVIASAVVGMSIIAAFFLIGSPATQRNIRLDERRINDLSWVQNEIIAYWQRKNVLPQKLDDLKNDISGFRPPVDPETNLPYEYQVVERLKFSLCANFTLETPIGQDPNLARPYSEPVYGGPYAENWKHDKGRACFERTIDPQIYRLQPVQKPF